MKLSKKTYKILGVTFFTVILGVIPISVLTGVPPFIEEVPSQDIMQSSLINGSQQSYFHMSVYQTLEAKENNWFPDNPYLIKLFIDNKQVNLRRYAEPVKNENDETQYIAYSFYKLFKPGHFESGTYEMRWELWVRKGYQGHEKGRWRIFIDYDGTYSAEWPNIPAGDEWVVYNTFEVFYDGVDPTDPPPASPIFTFPIEPPRLQPV